MSRVLSLLVALCLWASAAASQELSALARIDLSRSEITDKGRGVAIDLVLSHPVPYRVFTLDAPPRFVVDFNEVSWAGVSAEDLDRADRVLSLRTGPFRPGWSRMVLELDGPLALSEAALETDDEVRLRLTLAPVSPEEFAARSGAPREARVLPEASTMPAIPRRQSGERRIVVVLDPGHGGIDPGAEHHGGREADLMLGFARELKEVLLRAGGFDVVLTREEDVFVPLEARVSIARAASADVFISLHADALAEGRATGATIYTLSEKATDLASQRLAERHDREDLLAGVDLSDHDDEVATILMDLARAETDPRSDRLADALVKGLRDSIGRLHKRPRLEAGFSVLKAPDMPSVLIELGFMSSRRDFANLQNPEWRQRAAEGILNALADWAREDAAEAGLLRR
ncbi:MAG: N-acetylmuramoyl-L-alanine amidase [Rhodobacteraceae bacterium]|nr:N-acetylmuramoyl-L-alanine amidase [Paracoccaceae bacterium]